MCHICSTAFRVYGSAQDILKEIREKENKEREGGRCLLISEAHVKEAPPKFGSYGRKAPFRSLERTELSEKDLKVTFQPGINYWKCLFRVSFLHEPGCAPLSHLARVRAHQTCALHVDLIAASIHDEYSVGPSIRPICT